MWTLRLPHHSQPLLRYSLPRNRPHCSMWFPPFHCPCPRMHLTPAIPSSDQPQFRLYLNAASRILEVLLAPISPLVEIRNHLLELDEGLLPETNQWHDAKCNGSLCISLTHFFHFSVLFPLHGPPPFHSLQVVHLHRFLLRDCVALPLSLSVALFFSFPQPFVLLLRSWLLFLPCCSVDVYLLSLRGCSSFISTQDPSANLMVALVFPFSAEIFTRCSPRFLPLFSHQPPQGFNSFPYKSAKVRVMWIIYYLFTNCNKHLNLSARRCPLWDTLVHGHSPRNTCPWALSAGHLSTDIVHGNPYPRVLSVEHS